MIDQEMLNSLYRYGYSLTVNEADAYDLLQSSLAKFLEVAPAKLKSNEYLPYIRRMMKNKFIDQLRREKRFPLEVLDTVDSDIGSEDSVALDRIVFSLQAVEKVWAVLTFNERELLHLWAYDGFNAREIAEQLDSPRGTILSRIHRLRKKIEKLVDIENNQDDTGCLL